MKSGERIGLQPGLRSHQTSELQQQDEFQTLHISVNPFPDQDWLTQSLGRAMSVTGQDWEGRDPVGEIRG